MDPAGEQGSHRMAVCDAGRWDVTECSLLSGSVASPRRRLLCGHWPNPPTHPPTHLITHPPTRPPTHPPARPSAHPPAHPPSPTCPPTAGQGGRHGVPPGQPGGRHPRHLLCPQDPGLLHPQAHWGAVPGAKQGGWAGGGGEGQRQGGWGTGSVAHFSRHSTRVGYTGGGQPKCDNQVSLCSPAPPTCLCRPLVRTCTRRTMWRRPWRAQVGGRVG